MISASIVGATECSPRFGPGPPACSGLKPELTSEHALGDDRLLPAPGLFLLSE
jgi:hypothetical protein